MAKKSKFFTIHLHDEDFKAYHEWYVKELEEKNEQLEKTLKECQAALLREGMERDNALTENQRLREIAELIWMTTLRTDEREGGDHADRLADAQALARSWKADEVRDE